MVDFCFFFFFSSLIHQLNTFIVHNKATAVQALNVLKQAKATVHACDTETVGINVKEQSPVGNGKIICASIYCGPDTHFDGSAASRLWIDNLDEAEGTIGLFADYFADESIQKVFHNFSFDGHILNNHNLTVSGFAADTMHMARLWDSARTTRGGYSLEALSEELIAQRKVPIVERFGRPRTLKNGSEGKLIEVPPLTEVQTAAATRLQWIDYSTFDAVATWHLSMFDFYDRYYKPFALCLMEMERNGIYLRIKDGFLPQMNAKAREDRQSFADLFLNWAIEQCPECIFMNIASDAQKQQLLFGGAVDENGNQLIESERTFQTENLDGFIEEGKKKPKKMRPFVIKGLRLTPPLLTSNKKPCVSAAALKLLAGKALDSPQPQWGSAYSVFGKGEAGEKACRAIDALLQVSSLDTMLANFFAPLQANADSHSRVHCSLNLNTETGRLSSRKPNLQNQPALDKDRYRIREAFACDPSSDNVLVVADYGQIELRVLAHMTRCTSMIEAFQQGGDFHSRTAMAMYPRIATKVRAGEVLLEWDFANGEPTAPLLKEVFSAERRKAKVLNFALAYGKTARGLAKDWGVSVEEAHETVERWYADRPEVRRWQKAVIAAARKDGYTRTLMGRYRPLPDIDHVDRKLRGHAERAAINTPIQGGAADIVMKAMLDIHQNKELRAMGWKMLLQIHDEIIMEGPRASAEKAKQLICHHMAHPFSRPLLVDLVVDAKIANNWYEGK